VLIAGLGIGAGYFFSPTPSEGRAHALNLLRDVGIPIGILVAVYGLMMLRTRRTYARLDREVPGIFETRTLRLEPEFLVATDPTGEGKTRWEAVKDVSDGERHVFILLSGDVGYVVPKEAFATPEGAAAFVELANRYRGR
jgi:hypothetical protein